MAVDNTDGLENEDDIPEMSVEEFRHVSMMMALARIYDVLLVQIAQSDDKLAARLQAQHHAGAYLFPTLFEDET